MRIQLIKSYRQLLEYADTIIVLEDTQRGAHSRRTDCKVCGRIAVLLDAEQSFDIMNVSVEFPSTRKCRSCLYTLKRYQ